jgi:hypothetical protein
VYPEWHTKCFYFKHFAGEQYIWGGSTQARFNALDWSRSMDWRKLQSEPELTDNKGETFAKKDGASATSAQQFDAVPSSARKPSERFMRRSLQARSKASSSERFRIATLKEKMNELVIDMTNESTVFNGYRPGREAMPG